MGVEGLKTLLLQHTAATTCTLSAGDRSSFIESGQNLVLFALSFPSRQFFFMDHKLGDHRLVSPQSTFRCATSALWRRFVPRSNAFFLGVKEAESELSCNFRRVELWKPGYCCNNTIAEPSKRAMVKLSERGRRMKLWMEWHLMFPLFLPVFQFSAQNLVSIPFILFIQFQFHSKGADTAVYLMYQRRRAEVFAVLTNDSDFFVLGEFWNKDGGGSIFYSQASTVLPF